MTFNYKHVINDTVWLEVTTENEILNAYSEEEYWKGVYELTYFKVERVTDHSRYVVGTFALSSLCSNSEVVECCAVHRPEGNRHDGLSDPFRKVREEVAKKLGYRLMIATVDMSNYPALCSFVKIYWLVATWVSKNTEHPVSFGIKVLK